MTDQPLYVIVHCRVRRVPPGNVEVYDCRPDGSLADVQERCAGLAANAKSYGRPDDTYRVAELRFIDNPI